MSENNDQMVVTFSSGHTMYTNVFLKTFTVEKTWNPSMLEKLSFQIKLSQIHPTKYVKVVFFAIIYKWNYFHCIFFWFCRHMIIGQHLLTNISSRLDINKMLLCLFFKLQMSLEMMKPFTHRVEQRTCILGAYVSWCKSSPNCLP